MGLCPGVALGPRSGQVLQTELWSQRQEECEGRAKHQTRIEAVRLCAFTLLGSPLDRPRVIVFL